jgi:hypothetical protein
MNIRELIPKHKFDYSIVDKLKELSFEELEPIVPDLLTWLQDANCPIAKPVADILKPFSTKIVPEIIEILNTDDGMWKMWTLVFLARNTTDPRLLHEIERIAKFPTRYEIEDEVNLEAVAILNGEYE